MKTDRLTMAQALARFLIAQRTVIDGIELPIFAGVWAIFGHGNVAGMGEALHRFRRELPTFRAHNEQAMAHAAIAFAKASFRRRMMACTTSIGPGATNLVTAAAVAHVNRLPLLLLPGDVFANRRPDPVLQQIEDFGDGTVSANDSLRPVSRYFDRLTRPEQLIPAARRMMSVLTDPAECGPVTLALCQDVQTEAYDYPVSFFEKRVWNLRRPAPDAEELLRAADLVRRAEKPLIIAGGGVLYSQASDTLAAFAEQHGIPLAETQAGKSSLPDSHPLAMGSIGVTGTSAANALAAKADLIIAIGTRLQDFTTGSWALFQNPKRRFLSLNVGPHDASKHGAATLIADARTGLEALGRMLAGHSAPPRWTQSARSLKGAWTKAASKALQPPRGNEHPSDAQVIGAAMRVLGQETTLVCAAGGLPGELHKLWSAGAPGTYHLEYGYSCMGYEIAGGLGVKLAKPDAEVLVMVGDGSYLMMNSEIATSVMLGKKLTIIVLDNRGFGCIDRLQRATGGASFNNLLEDAEHVALPEIDFRAHAESLGAIATKVSSVAELERALAEARAHRRTSVIVIETDPGATTDAGGAWWDVAVPEISVRREVAAARKSYEAATARQRLGD
ncbi:MAG: 3D-(3,5/4)-trihydroxycyclohexane-1,2-dione acylhydrolase (decyclizing) [Hyphomicrobiales bacterium]|nr:3D-(3,5/4)-trihydroxycyclohexane-1,2-dione acylhydrolase (decyclizing) [Hyphomicrobiales bacterium]MBV9520048.1 3D-(3,5/4)-trihydroxycyclohexane-1,2-dione acylhydrolase (decyclizing) [Hyphomicrobiales bacterium]